MIIPDDCEDIADLQHRPYFLNPLASDRLRTAAALDSKQGEIVMRVFVTGATGFVGSAVVQDLLQAGHQVLGLARSDASAAALRRPAPMCIAAISRISTACAAGLPRRMASSTPASSMTSRSSRRIARSTGAPSRRWAGSRRLGRPWSSHPAPGLLAPGSVVTEDTAPPSSSPFPACRSRRRCDGGRAQRIGGPAAALRAWRRRPRLRADRHRHRPRQRASRPISARGSTIGRRCTGLDTGRLYRLALEKGAAGARYHGVAEEGIPFREIAAVIGRRLNLPVVSQVAGGGGRAFRLVRPFRLDQQPGLKRGRGTCWAGNRRIRADCRSGSADLLRGVSVAVAGLIVRLPIVRGTPTGPGRQRMPGRAAVDSVGLSDRRLDPAVDQALRGILVRDEGRHPTVIAFDQVGGAGFGLPLSSACRATLLQRFLEGRKLRRRAMQMHRPLFFIVAPRN
jgi:hypothetical protein